jgi:hypothetical protein
VPRLDFSVDLPEELTAELYESAKECQISPTKFASQAIEATLASRRLEIALHGRCGPRMTGTKASL